MKKVKVMNQESKIPMDKAGFLALAAAEYDKLKELGKEPDFYSFEATFDKIWLEFGRSVLEQTISDVPANHRKKTSSAPATEQ